MGQFDERPGIRLLGKENRKAHDVDITSATTASGHGYLYTRIGNCFVKLGGLGHWPNSVWSGTTEGVVSTGRGLSPGHR